MFGDYLLTLSIDTDRKLQDRIFRDLDPNMLYSMYGCCWIQKMAAAYWQQQARQEQQVQDLRSVRLL